MSELLKRIKDDLKRAMTGEIRLRKQHIIDGAIFDAAICQKTVSRAVISMFPEIGKKPADATDDDVIKLLKKYISQEKERTIYELHYLKESDVEGKSPSEVKKLVNNTIQELGDELTSKLIAIAQTYLPKQASEEEIVAWINDNIDFSTFKNKMQAMGPIMKQFQGCDGAFVKDILLKV